MAEIKANGHRGHARTKEQLKDRHQQMIRLHHEGIPWCEIAKEIGFKSSSTVYYYLRSCGFEPNQRPSLLDAFIDEIRIAITNGESFRSVSIIYGTDSKTLKLFCDKNGIYPPEAVKNDKGYTLKYSTENIADVIAERWPEYEYVGGYIDIEIPFKIRCKKCGEIMDVKFHRVGAPVCKTCSKQETKRKQEQRRAERQRIAELKRAEREKARAEKPVKIKPIHTCAVCGGKTTRPKYCSDVCANKAENKRREIARRRKIASAMVDKDITVQGLFLRDGGKCYLCGKTCDWADKIEIDGTIICGNRYPSIDHVRPLSKGGLHSWDNVKLAHRICNSLKNDQVV